MPQQSHGPPLPAYLDVHPPSSLSCRPGVCPWFLHRGRDPSSKSGTDTHAPVYTMRRHLVRQHYSRNTRGRTDSFYHLSLILETRRLKRQFYRGRSLSRKPSKLIEFLELLFDSSALSCCRGDITVLWFGRRRRRGEQWIDHWADEAPPPAQPQSTASWHSGDQQQLAECG